MTVRIRITDYTNAMGTYPVHSDEARAQLGVIAAGGSGELPGSYGDHPDPMDPNYSIVDYDPGPQDLATPAGRVKDRLRTLVTQARRYEVIGIGKEYVFGDGRTIQDQPAITLGATVFYDTSNCDGNGRWVVGTNGNHECTQSAVMLYHELGGHAFLDQPASTLPAQAEAEAIREENDLRVAMGYVARDESNIVGGCNCPDKGCCIVASVATGSHLSAEVGELRRLRDGMLRGSRIGEVVFDRLHYEYYGFSHQVCRVMLQHPPAGAEVERWLVRPLLSVLTLARAYAANPGAIDLLGEQCQATMAAELNWADAGRLLEQPAEGQPLGESEIVPGIAEIRELLAEWLPRSPYVRWAIVEPLHIYLGARMRFGASSPPREVGAFLAEAFDFWIERMPLEGLQQLLSTSDIRADLPRLETILGRTAAWPRLRARLTDGIPSPSSRSEAMDKDAMAIRLKTCRAVHEESILRVVLSIENLGAHPAYALADIRRLELDSAGTTLKLWLSERTPGKTPRHAHMHQTEPVTRAIDAGAEISLELTLPHRMTRIITRPDNSFDFEPLDLSRVRTIVARVAVHHTPFYFRPERETFREQLSHWGIDVEISEKLEAGMDGQRD